jgi:flagellar basal-body rod protein FlgB
MPISDIPILSMLRTRMQWHQERQRLLAENVANADTPNYRAHDLAPPDFDLRSAAISLARTETGHIARLGVPARHYEVRARGNAVSHEDEMLKLAGNQMDYEAVTSLSTHSLALLKTALGKS